MQQTTRLTTLVFALFSLASLHSPPARAGAPITYPPARQMDVVEDYHGVKVADPYRWLEDPDSEETRAWIEAQNQITFGWLEEIPARERIRERITKLWDYEKYGTPGKEGGRYFFSKNDGLQNQSVVYTMRSLADEPEVLFDPNKLSTDGTVALAGYSISKDGRYMAYGLSTAGSDWQEWRVREIDSGRELPDHLEWIKFSGAAWSHDHRGFYYSRYDEPEKGEALQDVNYYQKLYYHRLGTPQSEDVLVYERPDQKEWGFSGRVTDDGRYLIISVRQGTYRKNRVFYKDLQAEKAPVVELLNDFDAQYAFIDNDGPVFWFRTDSEAPRGRVIAVDLRKPDRADWQVVVPEAAETLLIAGAGSFARWPCPRWAPPADSGARSTTRRPSTPSPASACRARSTATTWRPAGARSSAGRRWTSIRNSSSPGRCSITARTAPGCRCSSATGRA